MPLALVLSPTSSEEVVCLSRIMTQNGSLLVDALLTRCSLSILVLTDILRSTRLQKNANEAHCNDIISLLKVSKVVS